MPTGSARADCAVVVCEPTPFWTPELQRQLMSAESQRARVVVKGCRKWSEMMELSRGFSRALQIADLRESAAEALAGLIERLREANRPPLVVLMPPAFAAWEWRLREAAVDAVVFDLISGKELARLCRRRLDLR